MKPTLTEPRPLTAKQERFCQEYLIDFNATQAAIRAGYSKKTAFSIGVENLRKPLIAEHIQTIRKKDAVDAGITREMVLQGYKKLAFYDARKFYDGNGNLLSVPELDEETSFALAGFEVMEEKGGDGHGNQVLLGYTKKIKMSDRKAALDSLCKVLGFNAPDKVSQTDTEGNDVKPFTVDQVKDILKGLNVNH
jgi:phage terminase small subunit